MHKKQQKKIFEGIKIFQKRNKKQKEKTKPKDNKTNKIRQK